MSLRHRGFTLIEILVVLLIFGIVIAMAAAITRGVVAGQKRSLTTTRIQALEIALVQYVMQKKRLPCPADGSLASSALSAGVETDRNASGCRTNPPDAAGTNQINGVIPWRELGLTETDAMDGWDRRFTYRVFPSLAADNAMDMAWCDPAGTGTAAGVFPNTSCRNAASPNDCNSTSAAGLLNCTPPTAFLANKGLEVRRFDQATKVMDPAASPHTGAAYILISHGESGGGGYLSSGNLGESSVGDSAAEQRNWASKPYSATYYYVDDALDERTATHFDDIIVRPSVLSVATKAGLGPRAH